MEFKTAAHRAVYEKMVGWMKEMFGEQALVRPDAPIVTMRVGSALVHVHALSWGDDDATVVTLAYVVTGAEPTADLMRFLLQKNHAMRFGAFSLDEDCDIIFEHTIVGSTLQKEELKASVFAVAGVADDYDDQIVARYGGQRAMDR